MRTFFILAVVALSLSACSDSFRKTYICPPGNVYRVGGGGDLVDYPDGQIKCDENGYPKRFGG